MSPFPLAPLAHNPQPTALLPLATGASPLWRGGRDEDANPQAPLLSVGLALCEGQRVGGCLCSQERDPAPSYFPPSREV